MVQGGLFSPRFDRIFTFHFNQQVHPKEIPRFLVNFRLCAHLPRQVLRPSSAPVHAFCELHNKYILSNILIST